MFLTEYNEQKIMAGFMEDGEEKGRADEKIETALRMIADGMLPLETIAKYADLPLEKVQSLATQKAV